MIYTCYQNGVKDSTEYYYMVYNHHHKQRRSLPRWRLLQPPTQLAQHTMIRKLENEVQYILKRHSLQNERPHTHTHTHSPVLTHTGTTTHTN